ncbi:hypothetical protein ABK040_000485 [Willaertia magna]
MKLKTSLRFGRYLPSIKKQQQLISQHDNFYKFYYSFHTNLKFNNNNLNNINLNNINLNNINLNNKNDKNLYNKELENKENLFTNLEDQEIYEKVKKKLFVNHEIWKEDILNLKSGLIISFIITIFYLIYKFREKSKISLLLQKNLLQQNELKIDLENELILILNDLENNKYSELLLNETVLQNILQCCFFTENSSLISINSYLILKLLLEKGNSRFINNFYKIIMKKENNLIDLYLNTLQKFNSLQNFEINNLTNQLFTCLEGKILFDTNLENLQRQTLDLYLTLFSNKIIIKNLLNDYKNNKKFNYINYLFEMKNNYDKLIALFCLQNFYFNIKDYKNDEIANQFINEFENITKNITNFKEMKMINILKENEEKKIKIAKQDLKPFLVVLGIYFCSFYLSRSTKSAIFRSTALGYYYIYKTNKDIIYKSILDFMDESTLNDNEKYLKKYKLFEKSKFIIDIYHNVLTFAICGMYPFLMVLWLF